MSVDVHNHVMPRSVLELLAHDSRYQVKLEDGYFESPNIRRFLVHEAWYDPDAKLREMDRMNLDAAVVSVAPKPLYFYEHPLDLQAAAARACNTGMADFAGVHPDRLRWMAHVPLAFPGEAATVLREAAEAGAAGVEIGTSAAGRRIDEPRFDDWWSAVDALGVPVFLHPAYEPEPAELTQYLLHNVIGLPYETTIALERMICSRTFDRFPALRVVAAHGGGFYPWSVGRLRNYIELQRSPALADASRDPWSYVGRIKFDSKTDDVASLRFLIDKAGPENVMIGTDASFQSAPPAPVQDVLDALAPDRLEEAELVLSGNARSWFGIG